MQVPQNARTFPPRIALTTPVPHTHRCFLHGNFRACQRQDHGHRIQPQMSMSTWQLASGRARLLQGRAGLGWTCCSRGVGLRRPEHHAVCCASIVEKLTWQLASGIEPVLSQDRHGIGQRDCGDGGVVQAAQAARSFRAAAADQVSRHICGDRQRHRPAVEKSMLTGAQCGMRGCASLVQLLGSCR